MRHEVLSFSPFLWFPCSDIAEEKGAFELPGAWWLSRFLQQTGSLSGYDDLQSTFSKLQFYIIWSVRQVFCSSRPEFWLFEKFRTKQSFYCGIVWNEMQFSPNIWPYILYILYSNVT